MLTPAPQSLLIYHSDWSLC